MSPQDIVERVMVNSDRMAVYVALISSGAAILAALLTAGLPALAQWWRRPKLRLDYDQKAAGFKEDKDFLEDGVRVYRVYIMVRLTNRGRSTARNSRIYLTDIESVLNGVTSPTAFSSTFQLAWPSWKFDGRELPPHFRMFAEVVAVDKSEPSWRFMFKGMLADNASMKGYRGIYKFSITATADNAKPTTIAIDIEYNGDWHNLRAVQQQV